MAEDPEPRGGHLLAARLLTPLAWAYRLASFLKRSFFWSLPGTATRVPIPVLSIGNPVVGGSGKTPLTVLVARLLSEELDLRTVILTRGYQATPPEPVILAGADGKELFPPGCIGDEGRLLIREVPRSKLVVSRRRALGARFAASELDAEVVVLDDGMQYWRLERDIDLVTLDGTNPFGNRRAFPAGLLREDPESLRRAAALILRSQDAPIPEPVLGELRELAPDTPIYRARYQYTDWEARDGTRDPELSGRAQRLASVACGIACPEPFFRAVEELAGHPLERFRFPDHHRFTPEDLRGIPGPVAMTGKDGMNLPGPSPELPEILLLNGELELTGLEGAPPFRSLLRQLLGR